MIRRLVCPLVLVAACSSSSSETGIAGSAPDDVACSAMVTAASEDDVQAALDRAPKGACVVLTGASYPAGTEYTVKEGVTLTGAKGQRPGVDRGIIVVGGTVANVDVTNAPGIGIALAGGELHDVKVVAAKSAGVVATKDALLEDVVLEKNAVGLVAQGGAKVTMTRGRVAENGGTSLTAGLGILAASGATLDLDGVVVEKNAGTGILVDGAATRVSAKGAKVTDNAERGIWVQSAEGTLDAPALRLEGVEVAKNRIVGVGALESRGIIVVGGRIGDTLAAPVVTDLAKTEQVGDGIGVFEGTGDVRVTDTAIEANARAAGIIDGSDRGIIVVGGKVSAGPSGLKIVVQSSTSDVQVGDDLRSVPPEPLGVAATKVQVPQF